MSTLTRGAAMLFEWFDNVGRDVRFTLRQFRRAPGFAMLAVLCLGLGIGVNTAIFGVINSVLLRPMAVGEPDRLVAISRGEGGAFSFPAYRDFLERSRVLSGITASMPMESDLDVDGEGDFATSEAVSANYGPVMNVSPVLGRWFDDDAEPAAVISYAIWERHFGLSRDALGRRIRSQSGTYTIVGVAPREFTGVLAPMRTDLWVPIRTRTGVSEQLDDRRRTWRGLMLFGRLRSGATAAQASADLNAVDARLDAEYGAPAAVQSPIVVEHMRGLPDPRMRRLAGTVSTLLMAVVALVLLIACVNVGNLLLIRGAVRQGELAMRRALGASRGRLVQQLLIESLVLAVCGAICGILLASWTNRLLETSVPALIAGFSLQLDLPLDWRVLTFATMVALMATVLCGLLPAWRSSRARALAAFRTERGGGVSRRRPWGLVTQVAVSLVLLFVAAGAVQALLRLQASDPGFDVTKRLYAYTFLPTSLSSIEDQGRFYEQARQHIRALPGVRNAALSSSLLTPIGSDCVSLADVPRVPTTTSEVDTVYFDVMSDDLIEGRTFVEADTDTGVVVLNESLARRLDANRSMVGERVMIGCQTPQPAVVIGIVRDSRLAALMQPGEPHLYRPYGPQAARGFTAFVIESSSDATSLVQPVRKVLLSLGQGLRVYTVAPLTSHIEQRYAPYRWLSTMLATFGALALLLAAIGLYGVIAYRVTLRTRDIGVRMALGAKRGDVFREVLVAGLVIVGIGVALGEMLTVAVTRAAAALQQGMAPPGAATYIIVAAVWIVVALLACYVPAARAARVDPMVALRHE